MITKLLGFTGIVGGFARDGDVVRVAFEHAGVGDAAEACIMQLFDVHCAAVAHTGAQTARHLIDHFIEVTLVRHATDDALWNEFLGIHHIALHIAVFGALLHSF